MFKFNNKIDNCLLRSLEVHLLNMFTTTTCKIHALLNGEVLFVCDRIFNLCHLCCYLVRCLTRFNKIVIQETPQMAVDKKLLAYQESTHTIQSVNGPYSKCNPP